MTAELIQLGDHVVLEGGRVYQLFKVCKNARKKVGAHGYVNLESLVGHAYNTFVKYAKAEAKFVAATEADRARPEPQAVAVSGDQKDNRNLEDTSSAQAVDATAIEQLKAQAKLDEIVPQLIAGSQTFEGKSDFAQRKYIQKKSAQYENCFYLRRPALRDVCQPRQVYGDVFLHHHAVQYLIDKAGVFAASHTIVLDESLGVLAAAILQIHCAARKASEDFEVGSLMHVQTPKYKMKQRFAEMLGADTADPAYVSVHAPSSETAEALHERFAGKRCTSLVIASHVDADGWFDLLFPLLEIGGSFAVFSSTLSALEGLQRRRHRAGAQQSADGKGRGYAMVQAEVVELSSRSYQVIPNCTHPIVQQDPHAGYIFSGIKVED